MVLPPEADEPRDGADLSLLEDLLIAPPATDQTADPMVAGEIDQFGNKALQDAKEQREKLTWQEELAKKSIQQNIDERKEYAAKIYTLICGWLWGVGFLLLATGLESFDFDLPESVLLAVVGSTTLNVLGIFYIVTKYLFQHNDEESLAKKDDKS